MRTSSIKATVSALAIVLTLAVAVSVDARPVRGTRAGRSETVIRAAINLLKRLVGVATNSGPSVPLGDPKAEETTDTSPDGEEPRDTEQ